MKISIYTYILSFFIFLHVKMVENVKYFVLLLGNGYEGSVSRLDCQKSDPNMQGMNLY